jgi:hypothetical protein
MVGVRVFDTRVFGVIGMGHGFTVPCVTGLNWWFMGVLGVTTYFIRMYIYQRHTWKID